MIKILIEIDDLANQRLRKAGYENNMSKKKLVESCLRLILSADDANGLGMAITLAKSETPLVEAAI